MCISETAKDLIFWTFSKHHKTSQRETWSQEWSPLREFSFRTCTEIHFVKWLKAPVHFFFLSFFFFPFPFSFFFKLTFIVTSCWVAKRCHFAAQVLVLSCIFAQDWWGCNSFLQTEPGWSQSPHLLMEPFPVVFLCCKISRACVFPPQEVQTCCCPS